MRYSVVMPVFNKALYIEASVASALAQPLLHELIIVDDGSTDGSGELCDRIAKKDARIKVIHKANGGVSSARNVGIEHITGDYVCFLDGDDLLCAHFFDKVDTIIADGDFDILFFSFAKTFKDKPKTILNAPVVGAVSLTDIGKFFYATQRDLGYFGIVTNKVVKSSLVKSERFDTSLRLAEDFDFWIRIYPKIKTAYFSDFCCFEYENAVDGSSCFDTVDYFSQLEIRLRYRSFLEKAGFAYDKFELNTLINRYKYFCIYYSKSHISAAKELKNAGHLPTVADGLPSFEKMVLRLCSQRMSAIASWMIGIKKTLGRVKRWIRRK